MEKGPRANAVPIAILLAAVAAGLYVKTQGAGARAEVSQGAPNFHLADLGGKTHSLSDYRGKVVLLNFWASWCTSCKEEMPALNDLYKKRAGDFELLAASVDVEGRRPVMAFAARFEPDFPLLLADQATQSAYGVQDLPTSFLIAPDGTVARRYVGPIDLKTLENDILSLKPGAKKT